MKPSLLAKTIEPLIKGKASIYLIGPPGVGKTSVFQQCATKFGWDGIRTDVHPSPKKQKFGYIEVTVPTKLVEDFGIPDVMNNAASFGYKMPAWFPYEGHPTFPKEGFINFDDRGQAGAELQKIIANVQEARNLHGVPMMAGWSVVSTGNRVKDRAGASRVLSHLADREIELVFDADLEDLGDWALANNIHPAIIAYWRFDNKGMLDFDPNRDKNTTPRGWCHPRDGINAVIGKVPPEAELAVFQGRIGEGHGIAFKAFMDMYRKLPNVDAVLMNPDTHALPSEGSVRYALSGALARKATDSNFNRVMTFANRLPPEFTVLVVKDALKLVPELAANPDFVSWAATKGKNILF